MDSKVFVEPSKTTSSSVVDFTQFTNASFSAAGIKSMTDCFVNLVVVVVAIIVIDR